MNLPINHTQELIDLITLAEQSGLSEEASFLKECDMLARRWDNYRYNSLVKACLKKIEFSTFFNRVFAVPSSPHEQQLVKGDYEIGFVINTDIPVGLTKRALNLHTLAGSSSGFGKTNFLCALSDSIQKKGDIIQWFVDPKNRMKDFRFLAKKFSNFVIITLDKLRLNPFGSITNVPRKAIMETAISVISDSWNLYDASQSVIGHHIQKILMQFEKPCFQDFAKSLLSEKSSKFSRRQTYIETIESRIQSVEVSLKEVFACRQDYFNELYDKNVIFEIGGISEPAKRLLVPLIISKLTLYKTYNQSKG